MIDNISTFNPQRPRHRMLLYHSASNIKIRALHPQAFKNGIDKTLHSVLIMGKYFIHKRRCFMRRKIGITARITMTLFLVMMIFGSPCKSEEPMTAIALSEGSTVH